MKETTIMGVTMISVGIDYSMTSPAVCIHKGDIWSFENSVTHFLTSVKKHEGKHSRYFVGHPYPIYKTPEERFDLISDWVLGLLDPNVLGPDVGYPAMKIAIEGYSMGSKGKVFHIAENAGLLKHKLWSKNLKFECPAPTQVKKFATGKGNANKLQMHDWFVNDTNLDVSQLLQTKVDSNPCSDIVDAYFMCKFAFMS